MSNLARGLVGHWTEKRQSTTTYDFEDGTLQGWRLANTDFTLDSGTARGSYSLGVDGSYPNDGSQSGPHAYIEPAELEGGRKISSFEIYWYEWGTSHGGGIMLMDDQGNDVLGVATDNDELNIDDGNGFNHVENGSGYTSWYQIKITFDWPNGTADVYWYDTDGGGVDNTHTGRPLKNTNGIARLEIRNQNAEDWQSSDFNMRFDDISYTLQDVPDRSAYDNHGDGIGGVSPGGQAPIGKATSFNGTDGYVHTGMSFSGAHSWSFWLKIPDLSGTGRRGILGSGNYENLVSYSNEYDILNWWQDTTTNKVSAPINAGQWHHAAGLYDGSEQRLYLDGSIADTQTLDRSVWEYHRISNTAHGYYDGQLADVRLYNRALSETEINQLYQMRNQQDAGAGRVPVAQSDLVAYYPFASSGATDQSGNGNHGTVNGPTYINDGGIEAAGEYSFNGSSDNITIPSSSVPEGDEISISLWSYGDSSLPSSTSVIEADDSSGNRTVNIHHPWSDGTIYWDAGGDRISKVADSSAFKGRWAHWVFIKNASTGDMEIYLDGVLWASGTGNTSTIATTNAAKIGSYVTNANYWPGELSDVRIYDRALSAAEVKRIYQSERLVHGGIQKGFVSSDLSFTANQWGGSSNNGEVGVSGTQFTKRGGETVQIGPTHNGVELKDGSNAEGFIMYSEEPVDSRLHDIHGQNADHLVGVRKNGSTWEFDGDNTFYEFTPRPSDHPIAELGWGIDYVNKLNIYD